MEVGSFSQEILTTDVVCNTVSVFQAIAKLLEI